MSPGRRRATPTALGAGALVIGALPTFAAFAGCHGGTYVYEGRLYVEDRGCLGTASSLDVLAGDEPGTCAPTCLVQRSADGGRPLYVATTCGAYPHPFDAVAADSRCAAALAALARNDTCLPDGGSSSPVASGVVDAGDGG